MIEQDLLIHAYGSDIFKKWHWYKFHFEQHLCGGITPSRNRSSTRAWTAIAT